MERYNANYNAGVTGSSQLQGYHGQREPKEKVIPSGSLRGSGNQKGKCGGASHGFFAPSVTHGEKHVEDESMLY
jgi:hypothetical protein